MGDSSFLQCLMDFPKEQITDETCELLEPYLSAADFTFASAQKASGNVAGLCNWCRAMYTYHHIAVAVEPKIVMLHEAEAELKLAVREKDGAEAKMAEVQAELDRMQAEFDAAMAEKTRLEEDAANTRKRMDAANALIAALAGEEARWTAQSAEFAGQVQRLTRWPPPSSPTWAPSTASSASCCCSATSRATCSSAASPARPACRSPPSLWRSRSAASGRCRGCPRTS
jgi:dynein heavy chain